jgi:hypothetical protein
LTDNVKPLFSKGGKVTIPVAPDALELEKEFTSPEMETWWLPAPVEAWVNACAAAYGIPKAMAVAAAMTAAAAVTQGNCSVQVRKGWTEPTSLYWLVFSPTGSRKSALLKAATAPVRALQDAMRRELEPEIRKRTNEKARLEQQISRMRRGVKAHAYTEGAQEHLQQLRELEHELDTLEIPKAPRWLYDDINPTVIPRKLLQNQEADGVARVAVLDAEGTFLANLLGRHSGVTNVDPLLKGYGGEPVDMVRAVHGSAETADTHIDAAYISLCLLVQPHYLDKIRKEPELISNGFLGRCLMTHLEHSSQATPWDAPPVPEQVTTDYGRWLASLAKLPHGTVYAMPESVHPELRALHDRLERDRMENRGAVGWTVRTLGRICRLIALSELSECQTMSGGGAPRVGVISKLTYLISTVYTGALGTARALEPTSDPLARLSRRALEWLRRSDRGQIGGLVTLRDLTRGLTVPKDRALEVADSLVADGYLEQLPPVTRGNRTLTISYKILTLEAQKPDAVRPILLPISDKPEPPPELHEYMGEDEDFSDLLGSEP